MPNLAKYVVSLEAQVAKYERNLNRANRKLDRFNKRQAVLLDGISARFTGLISVAALGQLVRYTDQFNKLQTRIRTATRDTGDFERVTRELADTAIDLGLGLTEAVDQFQQISRIRNDLGITNDQALQLNRTIGQLAVIGGTSSAALRNGLRQLNQALANGTFRAEEFNSLIENTPELVSRIAKGFGITQGALRELLLQGRLFSADVIQVLLEAAPEIADEFARIPNDLERAGSSLATSIGLVLSALDKATGFTTTIADRLLQIAQEIQSSVAPTIQDELRGVLRGIETEIQNVANVLRQLELQERGQGGLLTVSANADKLRERLILLENQARNVRSQINFFDEGGFEGAVPTTVTGGRGSTTTTKESEAAFIKEVEAAAKAFRTFQDEVRLTNEIAGAGFITTLENADAAFQKIEQMAKRREVFNDLFTQNLVQAADTGFDSVLESWARTLQQMAARLVSSQVFNFLSGLGGGGQGSLGGFFGDLFGGSFANGGVVPGALGQPKLVIAHGGERITPPGRGGGGNTFNIDARGAGPGVAAVIEDAVGRAIAGAEEKRYDAQRRGL